MKQPWQSWALASSCQSVKLLAEGKVSLLSLSMLLIYNNVDSAQPACACCQPCIAFCVA